jgi:hypothetical protein
MALVVGVPVLLLGEYAASPVSKFAPADPGRRVSIKRIAWALAVVLLFGCLAVALLRVQSRLGDPLGALGRIIAPHYH